jgi:hypothetical protein
MSNLIASSKVIRVKKNNFIGEGWEKDQVNTVSGSGNITSPSTNYVDIECAPKNIQEPGLNKGAILISLPTSSDPTLRRVRLRNTLHSGVRIADINKLMFSTFITFNINNSAPSLALQIDANNGQIPVFNIFFDPHEQNGQNNVYPTVNQNLWQQWDALNGYWQFLNGPRPELPVNYFTLQTFINVPQFKNAKIINTISGPNAGGGIRFTVGGDSPDYYDFKGYIDAILFGIVAEEKPILYDFVCDSSVNSSTNHH